MPEDSPYGHKGRDPDDTLQRDVQVLCIIDDGSPWAALSRRTTVSNKLSSFCLSLLSEKTAPLSPLTAVTEFTLLQKLSPK